MLPRIASTPPANDPNYVPQDSLCKYVYELSTELGYHITKPSRSNFLNFALAVFCKCSRDIVSNCHAHLTKTQNFSSQNQQIHDHVHSIQQNLAHWFQRNVPLLATQLFPNGPGHIETDLNKRCTKIIHIENQIRKGVRIGWNRREQGGIWVGQWFVYSMFSARCRRTIRDFPDSALLQGDSLPQIIASEDNPPHR